MYLRVLAATAALISCGCAPKQLSDTTIGGASAVEPIYRQQILDNLTKLIRHADALPSEVSIQNGTMQFNESVTPSVTFPLFKMFAQTFSGMPSKTSTMAGGGGSVAGTVGYQLNYVVQPITDVISLNNLRAIYMAVICKSDPSQNTSCPFNLTEQYMPPRVFQPSYIDKRLTNQLVLDPYYLYPPLCILCLKHREVGKAGTDSFLIDATQPSRFSEVLEPANTFKVAWLSWGNLNRAPNSVWIGTSGGLTFYAPEKDFANFVLATLPASASPTRYVPTFAPVPAPGAKGDSKTPHPSPRFFDELVPYQLAPGSIEGQQSKTPTSQGILPPPQ